MEHVYRFFEAITSTLDKSIEANPADRLIFFLALTCAIGVLLSLGRSMIRKYHE